MPGTRSHEEPASFARRVSTRGVRDPLRVPTRMTRWTLVASALALLTSGMGTPRAFAQSPDAAAPAAALTPPRVAKAASASRPESTPPEGATVDLELTIAADGKLTDAKVVGSAGDALDAAALEAVRQFTFEPARKGDKPIPAR